MKTLAVLMLALLLPSAALAQHAHGATTGNGSETTTTTSPPAGNDGSDGRTQTAETGANGERLICRRVGSSNTGTRLARQRMCKTAAQWRAFDRANN